MNATDVARIFSEMATLLELTGANPFRARAYQNAGRALESITEDIEALVREDRLGEVSGVGKGLAASIAELVATGSLKEYKTSCVRKSRMVFWRYWNSRDSVRNGYGESGKTLASRTLESSSTRAARIGSRRLMGSA